MAKREPARSDADLVRLEARRLASGLYRHRAVKWVVEIPSRRERAAQGLRARSNR